MFVNRKRILHCLALIFLLVLVAFVTQGFYSKKQLLNDSRDTEKYSAKYNSIQNELEIVEEIYTNASDKDSGEMNQFEMNEWARERFELWDNELISLLMRLSDELDDEAKDTLLKEQEQWKKQADANVLVCGLGWGGGSSQPCVTYGIAEDMTYVRVYVLAKKLAEARDEKFQIPKKVKENLKIRSLSSDDVFKKMRGQWCLDSNKNQMINIAPTAEYTESSGAGSKWIVLDSQGQVLSDADVYGYSWYDIVFEANRGGENIYYWISCNYDGASIEAYQADSLEGLSEAEAQIYEKEHVEVDVASEEAKHP